MKIRPPIIHPRCDASYCGATNENKPRESLSEQVGISCLSQKVRHALGALSVSLDRPSLPHRRCPVGVKRLDGLQPPRLALLALFLGPDDRLPVRREDEAGAGVGDFDAIAAGLVDVEEERLLDGMLVRAGLDVDAVL